MWRTWTPLGLLALGGAVGTLARYALSGWVQRATPGTFPWGTLAVNGVGCFLFGLVWSLADGRILLTPEARLMALVGFLGAFTTFSTFAFETNQMLRDAQWLAAVANLLLHNAVGVCLVIAGFALGRLW